MHRSWASLNDLPFFAPERSLYAPPFFNSAAQSAQHRMGPQDLHDATLAKTTPASPWGAGAGRRPAHKARPRSVSGAILARIPTDPCTQAGGAALPVRVTRKPCLPYHSGRRKETSEDGAHMPLLLSSMALPFRREQPELIGAPRQKLFRSDGCSSDRIAPSWCQVAGLPARYRARRISRGPTRESGTAPTVRIRHMPPRDLNRATCRCNAARR